MISFVWKNWTRKTNGFGITNTKKQFFFLVFLCSFKKGNTYYVYECEIDDKKIAMEEYEYETVKKYSSLQDVIDSFPGRYGSRFNDIHTFKGVRVFNVDPYVDDWKNV